MAGAREQLRATPPQRLRASTRPHADSLACMQRRGSPWLATAPVTLTVHRSGRVALPRRLVAPNVSYTSRQCRCWQSAVVTAKAGKTRLVVDLVFCRLHTAARPCAAQSQKLARPVAVWVRVTRVLREFTVPLRLSERCHWHVRPANETGSVHRARQRSLPVSTAARTSTSHHRTFPSDRTAPAAAERPQRGAIVWREPRTAAERQRGR